MKKVFIPLICFFLAFFADTQKKVVAQAVPCSTLVVVNMNSFVPLSCVSGPGVRYQFTYNNPTAGAGGVTIRLRKAGGVFCDSVCMSVPKGTGTLTTPCFPTCSIFDTLKVTTYPFAGCVCSPALAVTFTTFTLEKKPGGIVNVKWTVASDNMPLNSKFSVERSTNGINFDIIGYVFLHPGWSAYAFPDVPSSTTGKVFYRVSVQDKYTKIIGIDLGKNNISHSIYGENLYIYNLPAGASVLIYGTTGQKISFEKNGGTISLSSLPRGIYVLSVSKDGVRTYTAKFIK